MKYEICYPLPLPHFKYNEEEAGGGKGMWLTFPSLHAKFSLVENYLRDATDYPWRKKIMNLIKIDAELKCFLEEAFSLKFNNNNKNSRKTEYINSSFCFACMVSLSCSNKIELYESIGMWSWKLETSTVQDWLNWNKIYERKYYRIQTDAVHNIQWRK